MQIQPQCRIVRIHTFRGDRRSTFRQSFFQLLDDEKKGRGRGPSAIECLLYAGHTGVSTDADLSLIYGFNPHIVGMPIWQSLDALGQGNAITGIVTDDTAAFNAARQRNLIVLTFDIALSGPSFAAFPNQLAAEQKKSRFSYGFPDGDGDRICATWTERLGLPLPTGMMKELTAVTGVFAQQRRRFGVCS